MLSIAALKKVTATTHQLTSDWLTVNKLQQFCERDLKTHQRVVVEGDNATGRSGGPKGEKTCWMVKRLFKKN